MIKKIIRLQHIASEQELTAINNYEWKQSVSSDGETIRTLQDRGWSYSDSTLPISKSLAAVFKELNKVHIGDTIDEEFLILDVEDK